MFALYLKTKNFHWHVSGPHFRDLHLLFDEQADQIFAMTDEIAERVRKVGGTTLHSIGNIARLQRIPDNDADLCRSARHAGRAQIGQSGADRQHARDARSCATARTTWRPTSLIEVWIDQAERRVWFLYEASRRGDPTGH